MNKEPIRRIRPALAQDRSIFITSRLMDAVEFLYQARLLDRDQVKTILDKLNVDYILESEEIGKDE